MDSILSYHRGIYRHLDFCIVIDGYLFILIILKYIVFIVGMEYL
ncbi:putative membrane protein [Bacillus thuringiensis]|nr:putative membrane protein [Bacillus thuringiensis]